MPEGPFVKKETYVSMLAALRAHGSLAQALIICNKAITYAIYVAYPVALAFLFVSERWADAFLHDTLPSGPTHLVQAFMVPFLSFIALTIARKAMNAPRPYEVFGVAPLIPKETEGSSFPSRHAFSIFVIATTFLIALPTPLPGALVMGLGILLALIRVLCGVHFPRDVIAGALLGILAGAIELFL